jgi:hypothetical protein
MKLGMPLVIVLTVMSLPVRADNTSASCLKKIMTDEERKMCKLQTILGTQMGPFGGGGGGLNAHENFNANKLDRMLRDTDIQRLDAM